SKLLSVTVGGFMHNLTCSCQLVYVEGKSTTNALHSLMEAVEDTFKEKEALVSVFMDIEGAFDRLAYEALEAALKKFISPPDA
ncbi:hypothetical protein J6590_056443, partial [Homalodisca vitripennis]